MNDDALEQLETTKDYNYRILMGTEWRQEDKTRKDKLLVAQILIVYYGGDSREGQTDLLMM